jgi:Transposase IS66 family
MPSSTNCFIGGRIVEAGCWTHVRRKFFDVHTATSSPIAKEELDRIGQLYAVEKTINRSPPDRQQQQRQLQSKPIAEALAAWAAAGDGSKNEEIDRDRGHGFEQSARCTR